MRSSQPKMSRRQAKLFWNNLTHEQKIEFNALMKKLENKELMIEHIGVDDNENIQHIVLKPKFDKSKPTEPFAKHFKLDD